MFSFRIDTNIDIDASPDAVWRVLTDFPRYAEWNPAYRIEGSADPGAKLVVHLGTDGRRGMAFRPKVLAATPGVELRWLGKLGFRWLVGGEHYFVLAANDDGTTRLLRGERFSGALVALTRDKSGQGAAGYEAFGHALKARVEQLCQTP